MTNILNDILEDAKIAYKESIIINNETLEERLLSIIGNAKLLLNELQKECKNDTPKIKDEVERELHAIEKVKKRVPLWLTRPHQKNYKILITYMSLSKNNSYPILLSLLERNSGLDSKEFTSHYNQMKSFAEKAHGKIFEEEAGQVKLWEAISDFVVDLFHKSYLSINETTISINKNEMMSDEQLIRNLQSVGQLCFVRYFKLFNSKTIDRTEIIETLKRETDYTENSCLSRVSHAQSIIKAGRSVDALKLIINSNSPKVHEDTREKAQRLINQEM